ncbi:MAG: hypothetical protein ACRBBP_05255 [Bdellovibrionales bacterium]
MKKTLTSLFLLTLLFTSTNSFAKAYSKAFLSDYDSVWKGVLISLSKYPLDKNDQEAGEITTSLIKPGEAYTPLNRTPSSKEVYQLFIQIQKRKYKGKNIIQVKIEKDSFLKGDFINREIKLVSDGIEENIILYRTAREVKIDKAVAKIFK